MASARPLGQDRTRETRGRRGRILRELSTSSSEDEAGRKRLKEDGNLPSQTGMMGTTLPSKEDWPPAYRPPLKGERKKLDSPFASSSSDKNQFAGIEARLMEKMEAMLRAWKEEHLNKEKGAKGEKSKGKQKTGNNKRGTDPNNAPNLKTEPRSQAKKRQGGPVPTSTATSVPGKSERTTATATPPKSSEPLWSKVVGRKEKRQTKKRAAPLPPPVSKVKASLESVGKGRNKKNTKSATAVEEGNKKKKGYKKTT